MVPPAEMSLRWVAAEFEPELKLSFICKLFSADTVIRYLYDWQHPVISFVSFDEYHDYQNYSYYYVVSQ